MKFLYRAILLLLLAVGARISLARSEFAAFSLREAARQVRAGSANPELKSLGSLNRFVAVVFDNSDPANPDFIFVGRRVPGLPAASLDDLAVAFQSRWNSNVWPMVSIDPTADSTKTRRQKVNFLGITDTAFGRDLLECDVILKNYSCGKLGTIPGLRSYLDLVAEEANQELDQQGESVRPFRWLVDSEISAIASNLADRPKAEGRSYQVRFWFAPALRSREVFQDDVFCIKELQLTVHAELLGGSANAQEGENGKREGPRSGTEFAAAFAAHFHEAARVYPILQRLKVLYDLTCLAEALKRFPSPQKVRDVADLLPVTHIPTEREHELIERISLRDLSDGSARVLRVCGGVSFENEIAWLNDGRVSPLKGIVLNSRPHPQQLTWPLPLESWEMPNAQDLERIPLAASTSAPGAPGCSFNINTYALSPRGAGAIGGSKFSGFEPIAAAPPLPVGGVSMKMEISGDSFTRDEGGRLKAMREQILNQKPGEDSLSWPVKKTK